jgi:hypothetical protein
LTVLDKTAKERVINIAKNRSQLHLTFDKVKDDLEHHNLTPNHVVIESKYRKLKELMVEFPQFNNQKEAKQCYNTLVNKALLQQELLKRKSQSYNRGSFKENQLLNLLKFTPNENYQSLAVTQLIEDMLQSSQLSEQSADLLKKEIHIAEFNGRLKAAGVADSELENMKKLLDAFESFRGKMGKHFFALAKKTVSLDKYDSLPCIKQRLQNYRYSQVVSQLNPMLENMFKKDTLRKALSLDTITFESKYLKEFDNFGLDDEKTTQMFVDTLTKEMNKKMAFYEKWHHRIAVDAIQGQEDSDEVLSKGVCLAKCLRVGTYEKNHPKDSVKLLGGDLITGLDRFEQARYHKAFLDVLKGKTESALGEAMTTPKEVLSRYGYQHIHWLATINENQNDKKKIAVEVMNHMNDLALNQDVVQQLEQTHGVFFINLEGKDWGHALHCRLDFKLGLFRIHDPNIGIFEIPAEKGKIQAAKELSQVFKEIIETLYSDTTECHLFQLT